jgi:ADP-dependent glucokinase
MYQPTIGEVHLIMEFPKGAKLGQVESTRANRFITHCDFTNSRILPLEPFHDAMKQFNVDLLVLSGLHLLERESAEFKNQVRSFAIIRPPKLWIARLILVF